MREEEIYTVSATDSVLIYGAAQTGALIEHNLSKAGYNVEGFVDRKACEIKQWQGLPVKNNEDIIDKETVLVISLQNGMTHKEIADHYYQYGLNKIIMLPMGLQIPIWKKRLYRKIYFEITNGVVDEALSIPLYHAGNPIPEIIEESKDYVSFWVSIKYVYTLASANMWYSSYSIDDMVSLASLPENSVQEYYDLFAFLRGDKERDISNYLLFQKRNSEEEKVRLIRQRESAFVVYQNALKYDMGFFTDSPARLTWEDRKQGFIMRDGSHRVHFLISMGYDRIPGYCSRTDFSNYLRHIQGI